ncbi:DUF1819 family protein [Desemzia sp. C1]|uniref:DUF1819 family protein n=1 Tax=Desemzia sp. C1 TaxID=2892016 RepID=UPI001E5042C9|nr:DUF1819 family protein [Desemzia sp. C1]MCI3028214.1 DUF1819 family protein [Desemzia sp. C1]
MATKKYTTTLNTRPFMYNETKEIAGLVRQGIAPEDIKKMVLQQNIFQLASNDRAVSFFNEILRRLKELDSFLMEQFIESDTSTSKAILLYALLKKDQLFYEWVREVVWDKLIIMEWHLTPKETMSFFETKREQNEAIRGWGENTKKRLVSAYHKTLVDAELAVFTNEGLQLQPLIISSDVRNYLKENKEKNTVEILLGESLG